jgi:hypothetical protein
MKCCKTCLKVLYNMYSHYNSSKKQRGLAIPCGGLAARQFTKSQHTAPEYSIIGICQRQSHHPFKEDSLVKRQAMVRYSNRRKTSGGAIKASSDSYVRQLVLAC